MSPPKSSTTPASATQADTADTYDPLQLCVFATIALLGWLLGPVALVIFAVLKFF